MNRTMSLMASALAMSAGAVGDLAHGNYWPAKPSNTKATKTRRAHSTHKQNARKVQKGRR